MTERYAEEVVAAVRAVRPGASLDSIHSIIDVAYERAQLWKDAHPLKDIAVEVALSDAHLLD